MRPDSMARVCNDTYSHRDARFAWLRALVVALGCVSFAFSASAAAANKTAEPQQAAFREFIDTLWPLAEARGVSRPTFDTAFAGVSFDPKVAANAFSQPEFVRPIWDYVTSAVSPDRIARGRDKARSEALWLAKAKDLYGVDEAVIMGVWGLETDFGGYAGTNNIMRALASLAFIRFRGRLFPRRIAFGAAHS